jgi:hypothetical protein
MHLRLGTAAVATAALLLLATACGGSSDGSSTGTASPRRSTTSIEPPASTEPFPTTTAPVAPSPFVTLSGYSALRFGMTVAEAGRAVGAALTTQDGGVAPCVYGRYPGIPAGMQLIFPDGRLRVIEVGTKVRTIGNLGVGSTRREVEEALPSGSFHDRPNKYDPDTTELFYAGTDPATADQEIDFSITGGKVTTVLVGAKRYVELDEICS